MKTVSKIITGHPTTVGSIQVQELLPHHDFENPFILFHHGINIADKNIPIHLQGVGAHPHRGFSAISFIYKGGIHHHDSRGNNHIVMQGGTQWTHAGMGIIHSERVPENIFEFGGKQELLQVWVNTPASHKMDIPHYYPVTAEETPTVISENGLTTIKVPAGELNGVKGVIPTFTTVNTFMGDIKKNGAFTFSFPTNHQTIFYVLSGEIEINNEDHTIGNLLSHGLQNHKNVQFSGYYMPHPLEKRVVISYKLKSGKFKEILKTVIEDFIKVFERIDKEVSAMKI